MEFGMVGTPGPSQPPEPGIALPAASVPFVTGSADLARWAFLALVTVAVAACTSSLRNPDAVRISPEELVAGTGLGVVADTHSLVSEGEVLAVSPEMRDFLDRHVSRKATATFKLHQLTLAIINVDSLGVKYDDTTRTASETFRHKQGNCLSFSNMFVAMARDVGLKVQFQEVDIPADWTFDNDTFVLNQHVDVVVDQGTPGTQVVDFNMADFKTTYEMRRISDARALAHYYNNIGVARMQVGDAATALACFRRAIVDSPDFSPAWTSLGTLYLRNGHPAHAEAAFLEALNVNESDSVAMSNLAGLYEQLGDRERAASYQKLVIAHRMRNPYYRYLLARSAFLSQDYRTAIAHLKWAIRQRPQEDSFYFLLGLTYFGEGDMRAAHRWLAKAEEVAGTDALKRKYASKVDALLRTVGGTHQ